MPCTRIPAVSATHRRSAVLACTMSTSALLRGSQKFRVTYFTPASTLPFFCESRGGVGSTWKPLYRASST